MSCYGYHYGYCGYRYRYYRYWRCYRGVQVSIVLSIVIGITVKEVDINSKVLYVNVIIIIIIEVGGALTLIIATLITNVTAPYYTRFRTTRFYTTRFYTASKAIDKGIIVYRRNYILSGFN